MKNSILTWMWISSLESSFGSMSLSPSLSWTSESDVVLKMIIVLDEMRSEKERERRNITWPSPLDQVEVVKKIRWCRAIQNRGGNHTLHIYYRNCNSQALLPATCSIFISYIIWHFASAAMNSTSKLTKEYKRLGNLVTWALQARQKHHSCFVFTRCMS